MAEEDVRIEAVEEEDTADSSYRPPAEKSIDQMLEQDQDDESLIKYKQALLGAATEGLVPIVDGSNPKMVLVNKLNLVLSGMDDKVLDLTGDLVHLKDDPFTIKEGISYRIRIDFHVQREIVTGLKYIQRTFRHGIKVDKMTQMVGSYAPKTDIQSYTTPVEDAPSGFAARGHYKVVSLFTDDDENEHLKWEWSFNIKKDWD